MLVEIRPVEKQKWHGLSKAEDFTRPKTFEAFLKDGQYNVIFSSEDERQYLEKVTGYDLSLNFDINKPHPTWPNKSFWAKLEPNTFFLDTSKPMDAIKLAIMRGSPLVANSVAEYNDNKWPEATHVIYSEQEEYEAKAKKIDVQNEAVRLSLDMSEERKLQLIQIIEGENFRGKPTNFINVKIKELTDEKPKEFIKWATMDAEEIQVRSMILEAVYRGKLRKEGPSYFYGADKIGIDLDDAVKFLKNTENQPYRLRIMELLGK